MCIGAHIPSGVAGREGLIAKGFSEARVVFEKLQSKGARILSMGMSSDYEIALAEGSNCLRIGSQIFSGWFLVSIAKDEACYLRWADLIAVENLVLDSVFLATLLKECSSAGLALMT